MVGDQTRIHTGVTRRKLCSGELKHPIYFPYFFTHFSMWQQALCSGASKLCRSVNKNVSNIFFAFGSEDPENGRMEGSVAKIMEE